ncbi:MAG: hypothetical protein NUV61_03565 [Candidatus Azambacteria bacterium]|nr:hypothetical protein [Candidatus Azambacteria bacterium]
MPWLWILFLACGGFFLIVTIIHLDSIKDKGGVALVFLSIILIGASVFFRDDVGVPKQDVASGTYVLVGMTDVSRNEQTYLHMLLEREGLQKCYILPKDMVIVKKSTEGPPNVLDVVEKGGLKNATLRSSYFNYP